MKCVDLTHHNIWQLQGVNAMSSLRMPAVAGMFYPSDASECSEQVRNFISHAELVDAPAPRAVIVPHAGYMYSGSIAAAAYKKIQQYKSHYKRVVLFGPSHRVAFQGVATPGVDFFRTPLGDIPIDKDLVAELQNMRGVTELPAAHQYEHSLEVQLPFLQSVLPTFSLVPLVVGDSSAHLVAHIIEQLWSHTDILFVISSDLSHYLPYETAVYKDRDTADAIENMSAVLHGDQACGCNAINGLLLHAAAIGAEVECIDLHNSGDTAGDRSRVVGYGAFLVH